MKRWIFRSAASAVVLVYVFFGKQFISTACAQEEQEAAGKVLKLKWVLETKDQELHRLLEKTKGEAPQVQIGGSGGSLWCELVVRPANPQPTPIGYYMVGLYYTPGDTSFRIVSVDLRELRILGDALEEVNYGIISSPRVVEAVLEKAGGEMLKNFDPKIAETRKSMYNYAFHLIWDSEAVHSRIKALVSDPVGISEGSLLEKEWGRATISSEDPKESAFQIDLLSNRKLRVFRFDRAKHLFVYFGEFESFPLWSEIVNKMVYESPLVMEKFDHLFPFDANTDFKVTSSPLMAGGAAGDECSIVTTVENTSGVSRGLLLWDTPFDSRSCGRAFDVAEISAGAKRQLLYRGEDTKREEPTAEDCVVIGPGETLAAVIDLRRSFDIAPDVDHEVRHNFSLRAFRVVNGKVDVRLPKNAADILGRNVVLKKRIEKK